MHTSSLRCVAFLASSFFPPPLLSLLLFPTARSFATRIIAFILQDYVKLGHAIAVCLLWVNLAQMAEVLGAVSASLALVGLATKAVKLFSDMSTGFKDADGKAALIHQDLFNFKQSAKFAHHKLEHVKVDDLGLKQCLVKYEGSIAQLGHKMQAIQGSKRLWGKTKKWMELMSSDSEVTMLRQQLKQHTSELTEKFTLVMLQ